MQLYDMQDSSRGLGSHDLALIPSILAPPAPRVRNVTSTYFLLNFRGEKDRASLKNWSFPG